MYLSDFQKQIIRKIANDKIQNILNFLVEFDLVIPNVKEKTSKHIGDKVITEGEADFFFGDVHYKVKDREQTYDRLIDFKKVINLLARAELIDIDNSAGIEFGYLVIEERPKYIISLISSYENSRIVPYNEIKDFIKDFRTPQERDQFWSSYSPLFVAIATVLISSLINYFIFTNEREVIIKNVNSFKDSLYVKIIKDIDSSQVKRDIVVDTLTFKTNKAPRGNLLKEKTD